MGRAEWELAYIITQHLKPESRGLQTQCALTALPLNAKQTYIKQHKESNLCCVLFSLGVFLAISLRRRTLLWNKKRFDIKMHRASEAEHQRGRSEQGLAERLETYGSLGPQWHLRVCCTRAKTFPQSAALER